LNNEQRFEDLKDFEPTEDKDYTILNYELHELNNEQRFEDLKDFEPTDDKDDTILNYELHELHEFNNKLRISLITRIE